MGETEIAGFDATAQTLYCGNVINDQLLQVTPTSVRLVSCSTLELACKWAPPEG